MLAPAAVKRLIEPEEVAEAVAYLCSPAAASITGHVAGDRRRVERALSARPARMPVVPRSSAVPPAGEAPQPSGDALPLTRAAEYFELLPRGRRRDRVRAAAGARPGRRRRRRASSPSSSG